MGKGGETFTPPDASSILGDVSGAFGLSKRWNSVITTIKSFTTLHEDKVNNLKQRKAVRKASGKSVSWQEIQEHDNEDSCWIVVKNKVRIRSLFVQGTVRSSAF